MDGTVKELCGIESIKIPEEMLDDSISDKDVEKQVDLLSLRYADELNADMVIEGDLVYCRADEESYPDGRDILIFTRSEMPGACDAEKAVLGCRQGEIVKTTLAGKKTELSITGIIRRTPAAVNDELIVKIGIDNVATVDEYRRYVKDKMTADRHLQNSKEITRFILDGLINGSTYVYDEAEAEQYVLSCYEEYLKENERLGIEEDLTVDDVRDGVINNLKQGWIAEAVCKKNNIEIDMASIEEDTDRMIEMMELSGEEIPAREEIIKMSLAGEYMNRLFMYVEEYIDKLTGGSHGNS